MARQTKKQRIQQLVAELPPDLGGLPAGELDEEEATKCYPLLRGVLTEIIGTWYPCPNRPGFEAQYVRLLVWCPHCKRHHEHGWDPANNGSVAEHRVAHCHDPNSPFDKSGYFVSVFRKADPEYAAHCTPPGKAILRRQTRLATSTADVEKGSAADSEEMRSETL